MTNNFPKYIWQTLGLGLIAGMRSMSAPAFASFMFNQAPSKELKSSPLNFIQKPLTSQIFKVLAAGELVGDKLPAAPDRISPPALVGRALSGALAGAVIFKANRRNIVEGAILGGLIAVASSYATYHLRKSTVKKSGLPDPVIAIAEDALVIGIGLAVVC